jgi:hypothetical protein
MSDRDLMARVVYDAYYQLHPRDRQRSQWVMTQDMHDWIRDLSGVEPPDPPDPDDDTPPPDPSPSYLLGLPIDIRDGVEGIQLERTPSSWHCFAVSTGRTDRWWHERDCPHVDWTGVQVERIHPMLPEGHVFTADAKET